MEIIDIDNECRICYEPVEEKILFCNCKGSLGYIHQDCLLKCFDIEPKKINLCGIIEKKCDLCKTDINVKIYKAKSYYFIFFLCFVLFLTTIFVIYINYNFENYDFDKSFFYGVLIIILGILYYSIVSTILNIFFKNRVLFSIRQLN